MLWQKTNKIANKNSRRASESQRRNGTGPSDSLEGKVKGKLGGLNSVQVAEPEALDVHQRSQVF